MPIAHKPQRMRFPALFATVALAACLPAGRPPAPEPVRAPPPAALAPPPPGDWRDRPVTPGTWRYSSGRLGSIAEFGTSSARMFNIACDGGARTVSLTPEASVGTELTIRTTSVARTMRKQTTGHPPILASVVLQTTDPLLDAIAFSRGRFVVEQPGAPALVIPAWPEIGRVIEDCRGS